MLKNHNIKDLEEKTLFELSFVNEVFSHLSLNNDEMGVENFFIRHSTGPSLTVHGVVVKAYEWRSEFLKIGSPLVFITAFKLLDSFFEWLIASHDGFGKVPNQFAAKIKIIEKCHFNLPVPISENIWIKDVLFEIYNYLFEYRNTITHRERFRILEDGTLQINKRGVFSETVDIPPKKLHVMAEFITAAVEVVISNRGLTDSEVLYFKYLSDEISDFHNYGKFEQLKPVKTGFTYIMPFEESLEVNWNHIDKILQNNTDGKYQKILTELVIVAVSKEGVAKAYKLTEDQIKHANKRISVAYAASTGREIPISRHINISEETSALFCEKDKPL